MLPFVCAPAPQEVAGSPWREDISRKWPMENKASACRTRISTLPPAPTISFYDHLWAA